MKLQVQSLRPDTTLFALEGEFDVSEKPQVVAAIQQATGAGSKWLLFDMTAVSYTDSIAIGTLIGAAKIVTPEGGDVAVIGAQPQVSRIFDISGTRELLNVVATLEDARVRLGIPADDQGSAAGEEC